MTYTCVCAAGYTGASCSIDMDECVSFPCSNGATCVDQVNSFSCTCSSGFEGVLCETDMDECQTFAVCQNGASCVDQVSGRTCVCGAGWTGSLCETSIDECASLPCQNGGTCSDAHLGHICTCAGLYTGAQCESETDVLDECASTPCTNGGTCINQLHAFSCFCAAAYTGSDCSGDLVSVPASGGTFSLPESGVSLVVPSGVFASSTQVSVTTASSPGSGNVPPTTSNKVQVSSVFEINLSASAGGAFTVSIPINAGATGARLYFAPLFGASGFALLALPTTRRRAAGCASGTACGLVSGPGYVTALSSPNTNNGSSSDTTLLIGVVAAIGVAILVALVITIAVWRGRRKASFASSSVIAGGTDSDAAAAFSAVGGAYSSDATYAQSGMLQMNSRDTSNSIDHSFNPLFLGHHSGQTEDFA